LKPSILVCVAVLAAASTAHADRGWHGSVGAGGSLLVTGHGGDKARFNLQLDVKPSSRYGAMLAWRSFDGDHRGAITGGLVFEAGSARPTLVLDLHGYAGFDLDQTRPLLGAGIRTTFVPLGPVGIALDSGSYLVIDGIDDSRLVLASALLIVGSW
jgi:hypothetical protein